MSFTISNEKLVDMKDINIDLSYFFKLSSGIVKQLKLVAVSGNSKLVNVVMVDEKNHERRLKQVERKLQLPMTVTFVDLASFEKKILPLYRKITLSLQRKLQIGLSGDQDPIEFCNTLLSLATLKGASDVHIDPESAYFSVVFRIDGDLHEEVRIASSYYSPIISRIKVLSNMKIAEKREPQDGYIKYSLEGMNKIIELRTATLPTKFGERMALRLIDADTSFVSVEELGFSEKNQNSFFKALSYSYGFILVTGPTGSGKSTTLYTAMQTLVEKGNSKIITFEDPVERDLEGVTQIQVGGGKVDFKKCLRSVLRHDPDIIMIGEIRDEETADIAVRAAITGHLVLSTLHTNSAISTITRLADLNIDNFIIAAVLRLVTAQRLVRRLCSNCRVERKITKNEALLLQKPDMEGAVCCDVNLEGCEFCAGKGYKGRLSIIELFVNSPKISEAISTDISEAHLRETCTKEKLNFLVDDGLAKVLDKQCSLEDVIKVSISY